MKNKNQSGFTLLELAMVLMAVGFLTAAIWVAAEHVLNNYRVYRANQQITQVVQNIRDYYSMSLQTWPTPPYAPGGEITAALDALLPNTDIFPSEMRRDPTKAPGGTVIDHAINNSHALGSFHVLVETNASTGKFDAFRLQLQGLSPANCVNLLMTAPMTSDVIGFVKVGTNAVVAGNPATITKGTAAILPMTSATANTWCAGATEVDFDFALHN